MGVSRKGQRGGAAGMRRSMKARKAKTKLREKSKAQASAAGRAKLAEFDAMVKKRNAKSAAPAKSKATPAKRKAPPAKKAAPAAAPKAKAAPKRRYAGSSLASRTRAESVSKQKVTPSGRVIIPGTSAAAQRKAAVGGRTRKKAAAKPKATPKAKATTPKKGGVMARSRAKAKAANREKLSFDRMKAPKRKTSFTGGTWR